jgi:hypothetical protein
MRNAKLEHTVNYRAAQASMRIIELENRCAVIRNGNYPHCSGPIQSGMLCSRLDAWSSVNLKLAFIFFETTFKELEREALGNDEVLPCYRSTRTRLPNANSRSCIAVMIST